MQVRFEITTLQRRNHDLKNGVYETTEYLEMFLRNLLLDEKNELHNRSMHISGKFSEFAKADIGTQKADIESKILHIDESIISKTKEHIMTLYEEYGTSDFFGRSDIERVTSLKSTRL